MEGPLSDAVMRSLRRYLADMDGEKPCDLYGMVLKEVERPMLSVIMEHTANNQSRAAQILGINRNTLRKKLKTHGLDEQCSNGLDKDRSINESRVTEERAAPN